MTAVKDDLQTIDEMLTNTPLFTYCHVHASRQSLNQDVVDVLTNKAFSMRVLSQYVLLTTYIIDDNVIFGFFGDLNILRPECYKSPGYLRTDGHSEYVTNLRLVHRFRYHLGILPGIRARNLLNG